MTPTMTLPTVFSARWASAAQTSIVAVIDGVTLHVPDDMANRDRQIIEASGVEIEDYVPPAPTQADYVAAITAHIEATARSRHYDSAVSMATYVTSATPAWAAEAQAFVTWRDSVWVYVYTKLALVEAEARTQPTVAGLVEELPAIEWPEA
jgi:hypothetical protein